MSTHSIIGVYDNSEHTTWHGVYVHFDGYPDGVGRGLWRLYHTDYAQNLDEMLTEIVENVPQGWSSMADMTRADIQAKKDAFIDDPTGRLTQDNASLGEWLYLFDREKKTLTVEDQYAETTVTLHLNTDTPAWYDDHVLSVPQDFGDMNIAALFAAIEAGLVFHTSVNWEAVARRLYKELQEKLQ